VSATAGLRIASDTLIVRMLSKSESTGLKIGVRVMLRVIRTRYASLVGLLIISFVHDTAFQLVSAQCQDPADTTVAAARRGIFSDGVRVLHLGVPSDWPTDLKTSIGLIRFSGRCR
jgi:hypothetical protein